MASERSACGGTWCFQSFGRELGLVAVFTVMATLLPFWAFLNQPDTANVIVLYQRISNPAERIGMMIACSLVGALIVMATFLIAQRRSITPGFEAATEGYTPE